jgi:hypothetical protein
MQICYVHSSPMQRHRTNSRQSRTAPERGTLSDQQMKVLHTLRACLTSGRFSNYLMHAITACCQIMPGEDTRARQRNRGIERGPEHDPDAPGLPRKITELPSAIARIPRARRVKRSRDKVLTREPSRRHVRAGGRFVSVVRQRPSSVTSPT